MHLSNYLTNTNRIIPTVIVLTWLVMIASCGRNNTIEDSITIVTSVSSDSLSITQGESATVMVDIDAQEGTSVAGYTIDLPESEAKISISQTSCSANIGTSSCQVWTIAPESTAIPGKYFVLIRANSPNKAANIKGASLRLEILTNTTTTTPAAAVGISGSGGVWHIRTTDEKRWSWNSNDGVANKNIEGGAGVGGYFRLSDQGAILPSSANPLTVYMAANDNRNDRWLDISGHSGQGLSLNDMGEVYSWGRNSTALGYIDISPEPHLLPRLVSGLTNVSKIETSESTSFALFNGQVIVWGSNLDGLHGLGTTSPEEDENVIFNTVPGLINVTNISAGLNHIVALKEDGTVWSWGLNNRGQLGLDIPDNTISTPTQIVGLSNVTQISVANNFSLALLENGTVWSWGDNSHNQLGIGSSQDFLGFPQQVTGLTKAVKIAAGESLGFAIDETTGFVWRWGGDLDRPTEISFMATEIGPGLVLDESCNAIVLPSGQSARPGFLWDVRKSPAEPPKLLSLFGKQDPSCPNKLFLETGGKGTIAALPRSDPSSNSYAVPTQVHLTATANPGFQINPTKPWGGDPDCDDDIVIVEGAVQCIANFIPLDVKQLTIQTTGSGGGRVRSQPTGIDCGSDCVAYFSPNETITLHPLSDIDSEFIGWSGNDICDDNVTAGIPEIVITEDITCIATFQLSAVTLSVAKNGSGDGTITSDIAGIDCGADCDESYEVGTDITLTASPDANSQFVSWSGTGNCSTASQSNSNVTSLTINQDSNCTANFGPVSSNGDVTLTVVILGGPDAGVVTDSESSTPNMFCLNTNETTTTCTAVYAAGSVVDLFSTAYAPNNNVSLTNCDSISEVGVCRITMTQDETVSATFSERTTGTVYSISVSGAGTIGDITSVVPAGITGSIDCPDVNCADLFIVDVSGSISIRATPKPGSIFMSWGANQCDSESRSNGVGICTMNLINGSPPTTTRRADASFR